MLRTTMPSQTPIAVVHGAYHTFYSGTQQAAQTPLWVNGTPADLTIRSIDCGAEPFIDDQMLFGYFVAEWRKERGATSSTTEIILSPSYQCIIGMGQKVIPWILAEMEAEGDDPDHWFWAMQVLTRANPVVEEDYGDFLRMAQAWMRWARAQGYAW